MLTSTPVRAARSPSTEVLHYQAFSGQGTCGVSRTSRFPRLWAAIQSSSWTAHQTRIDWLGGGNTERSISIIKATFRQVENTVYLWDIIQTARGKTDLPNT